MGPKAWTRAVQGEDGAGALMQQTPSPIRLPPVAADTSISRFSSDGNTGSVTSNDYFSCSIFFLFFKKDFMVVTRISKRSSLGPNGARAPARALRDSGLSGPASRTPPGGPAKEGCN